MLCSPVLGTAIKCNPCSLMCSPVLGNAVSSIGSLMSTASNSIGDDSSPVSSSQLVVTTASPLQRMASITNSLVTGPPLSATHGLSQKPMKAVLPPITQQQFDMYSNINTEEIVKRVSTITFFLFFLLLYWLVITC